MKGKWLTGVLVLAMAAVTLAGCGAKDATKEKVEQVTLNEVAHSIFYAPQYVAIEEGYFADEGIDLMLITGFGADKVLTAMISGEADIGFMGAEATVYAYLEGTADPVVNFAQLTQRAGNFVVGREKDNSFTWEKLKNKEVLGGRKGGMPEMVFEYVLAQKGIDKKDVNINQSIDFDTAEFVATSILVPQLPRSPADRGIIRLNLNRPRHCSSRRATAMSWHRSERNPGMCRIRRTASNRVI